jgi:hypothetical protein
MIDPIDLAWLDLLKKAMNEALIEAHTGSLDPAKVKHFMETRKAYNAEFSRLYAKQAQRGRQS